jgi:hypothetical protein
VLEGAEAALEEIIGARTREEGFLMAEITSWSFMCVCICMYMMYIIYVYIYISRYYIHILYVFMYCIYNIYI